MQHIVESDMLVASASDSDIRAVHRNVGEAQRKDMRSTHEPPKAATRQSTSSFRIHIELSEADEEQCREHLCEALEALTGHPISQMVLSFMMSLAED